MVACQDKLTPVAAPSGSGAAPAGGTVQCCQGRRTTTRPPVATRGTAMPDAIPTYEEVAEAAARLREEGNPVTIDAVREIVGHGSAAAILRHLAEWRAA